MYKFLKKDSTTVVISSILSILVGLIFGLILMLIFNAGDALGAFVTVLLGGFNSGLESIGDMLYYSAPVILTGLAIGFAFKTGMFNIGVVGQFTFAAVVGIFCAIKWTFLPGPFMWIVPMLMAMLAGAVWAMIPALLKAFFNVNEVVSGIMANYIAMFLTRIIIVKHIFNQVNQETSPIPSGAAMPNFGLDSFFEHSLVNGGIVFAILACIGMYILLEKTTFGFQLKAVGKNKDAAKYAGINEKAGIITSLAISGALAGLAATTVYLVSTARHIEIVEKLLTQGFDGIPVALLAASNPLGTLFAGLFIGGLKVGGFYMQLYSFAPELIDIIVSVIIYLAAMSTLFNKQVRTMITKIFGKGREEA